MKKHLQIALWATIMAIGSALFYSSSFATTYTIAVNGSTKQGTVPHFWNRCVGTGGAQLCLDTNWKIGAKIAVAEAGFQAFRGHRLLSASNPISWGGSGTTPTYTWTTFDRIYDFLVDSLKTVPVVELSSMPTNLQSNGEWSPPKDYTVWGNMIHEVVNHCVTRYGKDNVRKWFWEVWNEWDYSGFWNGGTEAQYYQLYKAASDGAKSVDSLMMIGGPASTGSSRLQGFVDYCKTNNVKYDLLTNHCYGGGGSGPNADPATIRNDNRTRAGVIKNTGKKLYSFNTEYSSSYSGQGGNMGANCISMDSHVNAPFVVKCVKLILDDHTAGTYQVPDGLSYWAVSDVFDEGSYISGHNLVPFGEVFGLITYKGIKKATFNAFKMLYMMGATTRLSLTGGTADADGVDGFATVNSDSTQVGVIIYNFYKALAGQTAVDTVNFTISSLPLPRGQVEVRHYRVDSTHSNPYSVWLKQGKPAVPSTAQWTEMHTAAELAEIRAATTITYSGNAYTESFALPRQGLSLLMFKSTSVGIGSKDPALRDNKMFSLKGNVLRVTGANKRPIEIAIYRLDGKNMNILHIVSDYCDLRQYLPKGIFLVRARGSGSQYIGKIVVDK